MDISNKPMETIKEWQDWYRANRVIAELDAPGVSKDSREKPHNTDNATGVLSEWNSLLDMDNNDTYQQKAIEYFSDTIAEFNNEMTGEQLFNCFKQAVTDYYNTQKEELGRTKQLFDLVHGKPCQKNCEVK